MAIGISSTLEAMENQRLKQEYEKSLYDEASDQKLQEASNLTYFDKLDAQPTILESAGAAFDNTPIVRESKNLYNTLFMDRDPSFDPIPHVLDAQEEIGVENSSKLWDTNSKEEFDYMLNELREQRNNQMLASTSLSGQTSLAIASLGSMENLLFTAATAGVGAWGVVAKSASAGIMSNTYRGAITGGAAAYAGAEIDADNMVGFSHEDLGWAAALGTVGGGLYGRFLGNVYVPKPIDKGKPLYDATGVMMDTARRIYNRAVGKGYKKYNEFHAARALDDANLKHDVDKKRTGIFKHAIDDMDFNLINDKDMDILEAANDWTLRNNISERAKNITQAEKFYDRQVALQTEYAKFSSSKSPLARVLGMNFYEAGTGAVIKNNTGGIMMERLHQSVSNMYVPEIRNHFTAYANRVGAGKGWWDRASTHFKTRASFNEEVYMYMNAQRNDRAMMNVSPEVKALAIKLDEANEHVYNLAVKSGVDGFDQIKFKKGFIHQRHERDYYIRAEAKYGTETVRQVIKKAIMSKGGAGIADDKKATRIAKAFVNRFTDKPTDVRAGNVMEDDAWEIMEDIFKQNDLDFEGKDLKAVFGEAVREKAKDVGRARYAKDRLPLDLTAEYGGLRMVDLLNTDVENLTAAYAMSMSGNIALAQKGITGKNTWNKISRQILKEDPDMRQPLEDFYATFTTGRVAGGVANRYVAASLKAAVLGLLNNLGMAQAAESGTAMATYGIGQFFSKGSEAMKDMFKGRKSVAASKLSNEIDETLFPLGKEHIAMPPHLNQEMQANSRMATATMMDQVETALNLGLTVQGYTSLFNSTRSAQHQIVFGGLVHKIGRYINGGKALDEQLASLGFSETLFDQVKASIVKHGKLSDGKVDMLGFQNWDSATKDEFINIIVRNQTDIVQKALVGQSSAWMSKDYGALLTQFRKFPIESVRKQLIRKHTIDDMLLAQSALYNTMVAGSVITARNYLNGSNTDADFESALRQGISYNADLGSVQMIWDLGISLTGAPDALHVNPYAKYGDGAFSVPALSVANKWSTLPTVPFDVLDGDLDNDSLRSIRTLPIIGNMMGLGHLQRD